MGMRGGLGKGMRVSKRVLKNVKSYTLSWGTDGRVLFCENGKVSACLRIDVIGRREGELLYRLG